MEDVTLKFLQNVAFIWFGGFASGLIARTIRQFLEKATSSR